MFFIACRAENLPKRAVDNLGMKSPRRGRGSGRTGAYGRGGTRPSVRARGKTLCLSDD